MIDLDFKEKWILINGDAQSILSKIQDNSVDCCVTSPPYYALRDYNTGRWEGGDPFCDHVANPNATKTQGNKIFNENRPSREKTHVKGFYKGVCPKCGAIRVDEQIGLEETPDEYIGRLVEVFREVKRVLKPTGTLWINIGDSYSGSGKGGANYPDSVVGSKQATNAGSTIKPLPVNVPNGTKPKDLIGIPWMLAFALRKDGWYLRQDIIWAKPNPMPESVTDRCTKSHEYIFMLTKAPQYYFDAESIKTDAAEETATRYKYSFFDHEKKHGASRVNDAINTAGMKTYDGKANKRDVWFVPASGGYADENGGHYATYNPKLIEPCIIAGCPNGGIVLDPFNGTGTTGVVAIKNNRKYAGIDLSEEYIQMATRRLEKESAQYSLFDEEE